jgi:hypothetical protein
VKRSGTEQTVSSPMLNALVRRTTHSSLLRIISNKLLSFLSFL